MKKESNKELFASVFAALMLSILILPFYLPNKLIKINDCTSTYYEWFNIWGMIVVGIMLSLAYSKLYSIGKYIVDFLRDEL